MPASTPLPRKHPDAGLCIVVRMCLMFQVHWSGDDQSSEGCLHGTSSWPAHLHAAPSCGHQPIWCHLQAGPARLASRGRAGPHVSLYKVSSVIMAPQLDVSGLCTRQPSPVQCCGSSCTPSLLPWSGALPHGHLLSLLYMWMLLLMSCSSSSTQRLSRCAGALLPRTTESCPGALFWCATLSPRATSIISHTPMCRTRKSHW